MGCNEYWKDPKCLMRTNQELCILFFALGCRVLTKENQPFQYEEDYNCRLNSL